MRKRRRRRVPRAFLAVLGVCAVGVALNGYLALRPAAFEARLRHELEQIGLPIEVDALELGLSRGLELSGIRVHAPGGKPERPLLTVERLRILPRLLSLLGGRFEAQQVVAAGVRLRLEEDTAGGWNIVRFAEQLAAATPSSAAPSTWVGILQELPGLLLERASLEVAHGSKEDETQVFDQISFQLVRRADGELGALATLQLPYARRIEVQARSKLRGASPALHCDLSARKVDLSGVVGSVFPLLGSDAAVALSLKGFADLSGSLRLGLEGAPQVTFQLVGRVFQGEAQLPYLPYPLRGIAGRVVLSERTLMVTELEGRLGAGSVSGELEVTSGSGWLSDGGAQKPIIWSGRLALEKMQVDDRALERLPQEAKDVLELIDARGSVRCDLRVPESRSFPPRLDELSALVGLEGVSLAFKKLPYGLRDLQGEARLDGSRLRLEGPIEGRHGDVKVSLSGDGIELRPGGKVDLALKLEGVPLDRELQSALPLQVRAFWDLFQLVGTADAVVQVARSGLAAQGPTVGIGVEPDRVEEPLRVTLTAYPRKIGLNYRHFPYELRDITGKVIYDSLTRKLVFNDLAGYHGRQLVTGEGAVDFLPLTANTAVPLEQRHALLRIDLDSSSLNVDEDLKAALSVEGRRTIEDFNFKGRVKAHVVIQSIEEGKTGVTTRVQLLEGSVSHAKFPYRLQLASGELEINSDRSLVFSRVTTPEGVRPRCVFEGSMNAEGTVRTLDFDARVEKLAFDDRFVEALPPPLQRFVTAMGLGGLYSGRVEGVFSLDETNPENFRIAYGGKDIVAEDASMDFGLAFRKIEARGSFVGGRSPERGHYIIGQVNADSVWFNRLHLTHGDIDFTLGVEHPAVALAREGRGLEGRDYRLPTRYLERLKADRVKETFQALIHSDDIYGGHVDGFLYVDAGSSRDLAADFKGEGFQISKAALDVFGVEARDVAGVARGSFHLKGSSGDLDSIEGEGEGTIEQARLVELPIFLGLWSAILGDTSSRHYFSDVSLKYSIGGGKFKAPADGILIRSTGLSLEGSGTMDFGGNLDLTLTPHLTDLKIPLVEQLLLLLKKGLAQVWVQGNLSKPEVKFVSGAGILRIGIDQGSSEAPLPSDIRSAKKTEDLPPGNK